MVRAAICTVPLIILAAAVSAAAQAPPDYRGTGIILAVLPPPSSLHATRPVIVIEHEPIPPLMNEHMSMPFIAASVELFRNFKVGDRIAFGLKETPDALLVIEIKRLGAGKSR